ncbi:MAG: TrkH family potassium uptake protein [Firmicutes bacterium]|nr:TrkH family potassium uptake protein [Bacillota bacterium]
MTVNFNNVIKIMSIIFFVLGFSMIPALLVAVIYDETASFTAFSSIILLCFGTGYVFHKMYQPAELKLKERDGFLIVALCWLVASLVGALPFVMSGAIPSYIDAFFETCSGFSTTGCSILNDIEALPKSMLFWRSFTHWLGGMGIIVFATALLPSIGIKGQIIASAETPGPTLDKISPRFSDTARNLYLIYILFSVVEVLLLMAGKMNLYDALVHTFGTVGTGGFSSYGDSIAHFDSGYIQWVIIIFMLLCGINFNLYFVLLKRGIRNFFSDSELKLYLLIIAGITLAIFLNVYQAGHYESIGKAFTDSAFQVVSIITTTGYATCDYDIWPTFSRMLIFILMLTGACSSSTGGGVKLIRILVALKMVRRGVSLKLHPNRFIPVTVGNRPVPQEVATNIANFIFLYIFVVFAGAAVISLNGFDLMTTISSVMTCVGNIGPGFNLVGPSMNFAIFSDFSKVFFSLLMIAGRLELFTFFMLLSPHYWNANKV